jgi:hypothetical protein
VFLAELAPACGCNDTVGIEDAFAVGSAKDEKENIVVRRQRTRVRVSAETTHTR